MISRRVWFIIKKELTDGLRDRRALLSVLIFPFFGPLLIVFMLNTLTNSSSEENGLELPVIGAENAPTLIDVIESSNVTTVDAPEDVKAAIESGEHTIILEIKLVSCEP